MRIFFVIITLALTMSGCSLKDATVQAFSIEEVKPWERDILAQESMQFDPDGMQSYANDHIYFSREAATGGKSIGGGGCGCN
jgi:hypothetical protein